MPAETPKYREIINSLKQEIYTGQLRNGDRLATEDELGARFSVSRQTVRRALSEMTHEGLIESRRGSGSYVVYRPELRRRKSKMIGVVTTYLDTYIFPSIIRGIESEVTAAGYTLQLALTQNRTDSEQKALQTMMDNGVDGIILEPAKSALPSPNAGLYEQIQSMGIPLLFINGYCPGLRIPHVSLDDRAAGRAATEALLQAGHTKIGGIFKIDDYQGHLRCEGYLQAMRAAGAELSDSRVLWYSTENRESLDEQILHRLSECTAMVCYNDELAVRVFSLLQNAHIPVPGQVSLASIDDSDLSRLGPVSLTSVIHPKIELGIAAARQLLHMMAGETFDATMEFRAELRAGCSIQRCGETLTR